MNEITQKYTLERSIFYEFSLGLHYRIRIFVRRYYRSGRGIYGLSLPLGAGKKAYPYSNMLHLADLIQIFQGKLADTRYARFFCYNKRPVYEIQIFQRDGARG